MEETERDCLLFAFFATVGEVIEKTPSGSPFTSRHLTDLTENLNNILQHGCSVQVSQYSRKISRFVVVGRILYGSPFGGWAMPVGRKIGRRYVVCLLHGRFVIDRHSLYVLVTVWRLFPLVLWNVTSLVGVVMFAFCRLHEANFSKFDFYHFTPFTLIQYIFVYFHSPTYMYS